MSGIVLLEPKEEEEALSAEAAAFRAKWQAASGEEDAPPPLQWQSQSATAPHADVRTAATQPAKAPAPPAGVRRGFFDAPRGRAAPKAVHTQLSDRFLPSRSPLTAPLQPELISLKAPAKTGPVIPDFLKARQHRRSALRFTAGALATPVSPRRIHVPHPRADPTLRSSSR
jgi:hypothetical protein